MLKKNSLAKIVLIGDKKVGKTSIMNKYVQNQFSEKYYSIIVISLL